MLECGNFNCLNYVLNAYISDFNIDFSPKKNVLKKWLVSCKSVNL
jgi:hypothetical protein